MEKSESTKLGRCECRERECGPHSKSGWKSDRGGQCVFDAVRVLTFKRVVRVYSNKGGFAQGIGWLPDWVNREETKEVTLCAACAEWHERNK